MGEVSRGTIDPTNLKFNNHNPSLTIESDLNTHLTLINTKDVTYVGKEEKKIVRVAATGSRTTREETGDDDVNADVESIHSGLHSVFDQPVSENTQKHQHVPCRVPDRSYSHQAEPSNAAETDTPAEDSSYDSDNDSNSSTNSSQLGAAHHTSMSHLDVSRTVSDTLAAEFADYVTVHQHQPKYYQEPLNTQKNAGYMARVEFALKLGYTERLVQAALHKLGPEPGQDKLLAELIKLGASPSRICDNSDENVGVMMTPMPETESNIDEASNGAGFRISGILLRPVVIDGSNVAMSHGNKELFSCRGIKICVDWFRMRGHKEITVFVPKWRKESCKPDNRIADQDILGELERERLLVFTPSRLVNGKRLVCYDDRYILRLAVELDGIVVSNDNYRDLAQENPEFRRVIEERILMYSFVNDRFMPPDDPLGRGGPTLDNFLKITPRRSAILPCPYAKKCTYGNKCKFRHPERGELPQKSVTEQLVEHAQRHLQARGPSLSLPLSASVMANKNNHRPLCRTKSDVSQCSTSGTTSQIMNDDIMNISVEAPTQRQHFTGWRTSCATHSEAETTNKMHEKSQQHSTLISNCDPRLQHMRKYRYCQQPSPLSAQSDSSSRMNFHRKLLAKNDSNNNQSNKNNMSNNDSTMNSSNNKEDNNRNNSVAGGIPSHYNHKHVTRIASAPDSYLGWPTFPSSLSATLQSPSYGSHQQLGISDSQKNLLSHTPTSMPNLCMSQDMQIHDARRHLHYHLSNIFPDEHVQVAMTLHPNETNPQRICASILSMFPKPFDR